MYFFVPALGNVGVGISVITCCDILKLGLTCDTGFVKDSKRLMEIIEKNFEQCIEKN